MTDIGIPSLGLCANVLDLGLCAGVPVDLCEGVPDLDLCQGVSDIALFASFPALISASVPDLVLCAVFQYCSDLELFRDVCVPELG